MGFMHTISIGMSGKGGLHTGWGFGKSCLYALQPIWHGVNTITFCFCLKSWGKTLDIYLCEIFRYDFTVNHF